MKRSFTIGMVGAVLLVAASVMPASACGADNLQCAPQPAPPPPPPITIQCGADNLQC